MTTIQSTFIEHLGCARCKNVDTKRPVPANNAGDERAFSCKQISLVLPHEP